jgi:acetoin utilization deacetylase AcuC-like enzyme
MAKFRRLYELLTESGMVREEDVYQPEPARQSWLELAHSPGYVHEVCSGSLDQASIRRIGLPMNETLVSRSLAAVGGTVLAARLALEYGIACNAAGGSHHAFSSYGSGYCVFNDVAVAARVLLDEGRVRRVLIIDLDVHQGDGTAEILAGEPGAFTFSMHCAENFPKAKQASDRDVSLPAGTGDDEYLSVLLAELTELLPAFAPQLVIYNAGVDPHRDDRLGKLALSDEGIAARERAVLNLCREGAVPLACVVGGGYDMDADVIARRHMILHREAGRLADRNRRWRGGQVTSETFPTAPGEPSVSG